MTTFKFLTYEEWLEQNPDIAKSRTDCEACNGTGDIECYECSGDGRVECSQCGHESKCDVCDGTGKVSCEECDGLGYTDDSKKEYEKQLKRDQHLVEVFTRKKAQELQ